jgi:D-proline reductase (dithiol) PrdB
MVRLSDLAPAMADALRAVPLPTFDTVPWVSPPPLPAQRIALISTAGLHRRSDDNFRPGASDYRLIPGDVAPGDLVMSHVSVNFDRSGFQQDLNVVFPLELLKQLAESGEIGSVAGWHYSFMGASDPSTMEQSGAEVARLLKGDGVDAALLVPV